jgi:tetraacyldisaccharide 4'-kinase
MGYCIDSGQKEFSKRPLYIYHVSSLISFMIQRTLLFILLGPFSLLYGLGVSVRNFFYRAGILKEVSFDMPVISVGNLSVGGAGKSPHIEYLIRLLKDYIYVATLSRGYKRKTKGYREVQVRDSAELVGDEPLQFKRKFRDIAVAVSESRTFGIVELMKQYPQLQAILLDDAFQHLAVKPGLNILLTEYDRPYSRDWLLPSGRLREWRSAAHRADIVIVSKCPPQLEPEEEAAARKELQLAPAQQLFFSYYNYGLPYYLFNSSQRIQLQEELDVLLLCGIARPEYLTDYLEDRVNDLQVRAFDDHHFFTRQEVSHLVKTFHNMPGKKKVMLTTEKDATRLELHRDYLLEQKVPLFVIPVEVQFHFDRGPLFDEHVRQFLLNFRR